MNKKENENHNKLLKYLTYGVITNIGIILLILIWLNLTNYYIPEIGV